jgi:methyl-branched lipid omega-hydroxylase
MSNARLSDIDLSADEFWARPLDARYDAFRRLRATPGLTYYDAPDPRSAMIDPNASYYAVVRHADIKAASAQPEIFSSAAGATSIPDLPPEFLEFFGSMINMDAPRHVRLRRIVSQAFTPRMMSRIETDVAEVARAIVDRLAEGPAADGAEFDFVAEVAAPLPLTVICNLMGVPDSEAERVFRCSNVILGAGDPEYVPEGGDLGPVLLSAGAELAELVSGLCRLRRESPTGDLVTALADAEVDGERLTDAEIASFFVLLSVAGNETTRNALSHALVGLTAEPDQRTHWLSDFEALAPGAVEEIVRWSSPVIWMRRTVLADTAELGGQQLRKGDRVLLYYASGNRDETVFDDPERFDLRRSPNPHLGFGGAGPHYCLGAHLARREITVLYRALLQRFPAVRTTGEPARLASSFVNGIKHLPASLRD